MAPKSARDKSDTAITDDNAQNDNTDRYYWSGRPLDKPPWFFNNRKSLPEPWCGVRDAALDELSGIPGCVFVHANGFIGGNKTYDGALAMAVKAVEWS